MPLRIGASTFSHLYDHPFGDTLRRIAELGFRYVELLTMPPHLRPGELDGSAKVAMRAQLEALGLEVVAIGPMYFDLNLASTNPAVREVSVREVVDNVRLAADLGGARVVTIAGRTNPLFPAPPELTWKLGRDSLGRCLQVAEELGTNLCLEPIPYSYISTGLDARRMIEEIGSPRLRALIDTANSHATEGVAAAVGAVGPLLDHVQLSDTVQGQFRHDPVGDGEIDFAAAAAAVRATGYDRPCVLELCYPTDPNGGLRRSVERLQQVGFKT